MLKSLCGLRKQSKSKNEENFWSDTQDFSTAAAARETTKNMEVSLPPKKQKLLIADRDLMLRNRIKKMGGTHTVNLYQVGNDLVICKEYPVWVQGRRESMENEVFAYKFSKKLGLDLVPETAFVQDCDGKIVSRFIKSITPRGGITRRGDHKLFLFDYLLETGDRDNTSDHNIINAVDGNIYAIDNESTLSSSIGGHCVESSDIEKRHMELFFEKDLTKIKFMNTDWSAFFDKHTSNRSSEAKQSFLDRIEFIKKRLTTCTDCTEGRCEQVPDVRS